ncbi:MAG: DUF502 domain-containing protein [Proteobacteria bacterium]|nr:MAG: DUF502 domain-containing protein [Pseudomonadota bacterium]
MNQLAKNLRQIFFKGLFTFLPMALTIYILYAGIVIMEGMMGTTLARLFPEFYYPGFGFLLTIILIFILGFLLNNLITASFFGTLEKVLLRVPFIKAIYSPLKDLMNLFSHNGASAHKSVVLVDIGGTGVKMLGLVTREDFRDLSLGPAAEGRVAVFIPFSYGLGGYTVLVEHSRLTDIDMPAERAMSLAITGWVKVASKSEVPFHEGDRPS